MWRVFTPFNIIGLLILALALSAYWYINLPGQYQNRLPVASQVGEVELLRQRLFFAATSLDGFAIETRSLRLPKGRPAARAQVIIEAWLTGASSQTALLPFNKPASLKFPAHLPKTLFEIDNTITIDLPDIWRTIKLGTFEEYLFFCGISKSLFEDGPKQVQFLLAGKITQSILGHLDTDKPFDTNICGKN
jgi:hypothetical protein